jgi:hypothetical protein
MSKLFFNLVIWSTARDLLKRLGSKRSQLIGWRDMWAMVLVKKDKVFGEAMSKSPGIYSIKLTPCPPVPKGGKGALTPSSKKLR